ncbi:F-box domain-containing protein [Entamoeba marina]
MDSIETLEKFHMVSKKVNHAVDATKINPGCGLSSVIVSLLMKRKTIMDKELKVFENLDTLHMPFDLVESFDVEKQFKNIKLFEIYKFMVKKSHQHVNQLKLIEDRISVIGIDCTYSPYVNIDKLVNLRILTIRLGELLNENCLFETLSSIKTLPSLQKVIILFNSNQTKVIKPYITNISHHIKLVLECMWFEDRDADDFFEFVEWFDGKVGIWDVNTNNYFDWFVNPNKVVLIPFIPRYLKVSQIIRNHPMFEEINRLYYPHKLDVQ